MDYTRSSLLNLSPYFCHGKSLEELGQSWLCPAVELESLKMQAEEEIRRRDEQLGYVKELLYKAMKERDEAVQKCRTLHVETLFLQHQQQLRDPDSTNNLSSSECDHEIIVSSPATPTVIQELKQTSKSQSFHEEVMQWLLPERNRSLPEKGKLLQAVMNAGPLLHTLLLAGPLPQWRHPPPPLHSFEIPPVTINIDDNKISRKRGLATSDCSDSSTDSHKLHKQAP